MSTYVIGDVQGCFLNLERLLREADFSPKKDRLWLVGDLINRGPHSLETLRFVRDLGDSAVTVLGNHDLHFLAIVFGGHQPKAADTFDALLKAPDCLDLAHWLRHQPLLHEAEQYVMVHAGIPHIWSLKKSRRYAREVEEVLAGTDYGSYFREMYGNCPHTWDDGLAGMARLRSITNYLTRMRLTDSVGRLDFDNKSAPLDPPEGFAPWFAYEPKVKKTVVFGHWAALDGLVESDSAIALDTGCVWGRCLTALRLEDQEYFSVGCA